jgi:hypothetical protein
VPETRKQRTVPNESACVKISTRSQVYTDPNATPSNSFGRYLPIEKANEQIRDALSNHENTRSLQVIGVGATKTGYIVRFRDEHSAKIAREDTQWLSRLGNDTKVVTPRFGVVVHRVPVDLIDDKEGKEKSIQRIAEENELALKGSKCMISHGLKAKKSRGADRQRSGFGWTPQRQQNG